MRLTGPRTLAVSAAGLLGAAHVLPALAVAPGGRKVFLTHRHIDGAPGRVALTFDDGPEPAAVDGFLESLAELKVRATFFLVGEQVRRAPQAARRIVDAGHEIACHGYRHLNHLRLTPWATARDLRSARDVIVGETGAHLQHFRPPFGVFNSTSWMTAQRLGWNRVLWSQWGKDWEPTASPDLIRSRLLERVADHDILLLHDAEAYSSAGSWRRTLAALKPIVEELRSKGLEPGPVGTIAPGGSGTG